MPDLIGPKEYAMKVRPNLVTLALCLAGATTPVPALAQPSASPTGAKNIVIVPGAFVDGSGWRAVFDILTRKGYTVRIVQPPHDTLENDITATNEVLASLSGPTVLVGHSYGGNSIGVAGTNEKVRALVYVAAFIPEIGESAGKLAVSMPAPSDDIRPTSDGRLFFDIAKFSVDFAGDVPKTQTVFMANAQVPVTIAAFNDVSSAAAWHDKPTYAIVTTDDHALSPSLQRWMYKRAKAKVTEVKSSHVVYMSHPDAVAKTIEEAARAVK
jgi:pimeloyl-ACP methyl ester carboxylesterase